MSEIKNPFDGLDRINLSSVGFSQIEKLFNVKLPSLSALHDITSIKSPTKENIKEESNLAKPLRDAYLSVIQGNTEEGAPKITPPNASKYQSVTAAIVMAWVGIEQSKKLFDSLSRLNFTHSQRLHDARVSSGCIAKPLVFMSNMLINPETDATNTLAVTCRALIDGAFDSTRAGAHSGMFLPLITKVLMVDEGGELKADLLQNLIKKCLAEPSFEVNFPIAHSICVSVMALCSEEFSEKHPLDKIILSPDVEPRAFVVANPIYQPTLKKLALQNVALRIANYLDIKAEKEGNEKNKKSEEFKLSGAYSFYGSFAPHAINNAVNGGGILNAMAGKYATPILLPPSIFGRRSSGENYSHTLKIATLINESLKSPLEDATANSKKLIAKNLASSVVNGLFDETFETLISIAYSFKSTFNDLSVNSKKRKTLILAGSNSYAQYKSNLKKLVNDAFIADVAAKLKVTDNSLETTKAFLIHAVGLALNTRYFSSAIVPKLNFKQRNLKSLNEEHVSLFKKGITVNNSGKLTEKLTEPNKQHMPEKLGRWPVIYTDGLTTALHIRIKAENCTLYGGLTAGIPNFTAQHGLMFKTLKIDNGIDFNKSLMVIHDIAPQFTRTMHSQRLTTFRNKENEDQWSVALQGPHVRPFLSARDKPADKEPLQSTFEADCDLSFVVLINPTTFSEKQLKAIQYSLMAGRFSGGNITSATVANVINGLNNTDKYHHEQNWQLPQGYLLKSLVNDAVGVDNMMERMMAHNLFYRGERVSEILPELKFEGAKAAFGFAMAGVMDLGVNANSKVTMKGKANIDCNFAEPIFFPVELSHTRHLSKNGLLSHYQVDGDPVQWVSYEEEVNKNAKSYILTIE